MRIAAATVVAFAVLGASPLAVGAESSRVSVLYDSAPAINAILAPADGPALGADRGAVLQNSSPAVQGASGVRVMAKVTASQLRGLTPEAMAARLRAAIGTDGKLVGIDEIGREYGEPAPSGATKGSPPAPVRPDSLGARFTEAMRLLDTPAPFGATWASRVHAYVAPGIHTSIGAGLGPDRNLGRNGVPLRRTWRGVMPGLGLAGGLHLQMYHALSASGPTALGAEEWRQIPPAFAGLLARYGGQRSRVHFLFTSTGSPDGASGCATPMSCQWRMAASTPAGRAILANGPGVYKVGAQAAEWLQEYNKRYPR
jgi:hypothetical protein